MKGLALVCDWWIGELQSLVADLRSHIPQQPTSELRVLYQPDAMAGENDTWVTDEEASWARLAEDEANDRKKTLTVLIPEAFCLVRTSSYPSVPQKELRDIIGLELATTTPFSKANASWTWRRRPDGKTDVVIVKRELIDRITALARDAGLVLSEIRGADTDLKSPPFESYETPAARRDKFWQKVNLGLATALVLLVVLTVTVDTYRKSSALEHLKAEIAAKTEEARDLRAAMTEREKAAEAILKLKELKNDRTSVVETWARITSLLPESAWVSELVLERDGGSIVGFSADAASLIELLERDPAFRDVAFATAIRIDPLSTSERFDIRFAGEAAK
jgi:general secretion pathway protein L